MLDPLRVVREVAPVKVSDWLRLVEPARQVEAVAVDVVLVGPEPVGPVEPELGERARVVEVVEHVERVGRLDVGPRVLGRRPPKVALVVEADEGALPRRVVVDHVEDDGHAPPVGRVDERLELVRRPVVLVDGEVEGRVVAPRLVAVVLRDGHELDRVDAQPVEVVERVHECREAVGAEEVAEQQLVDHQVLLGRGLEAGVGPGERRGARREDADRVLLRALGVAGLAGVVHLRRVRVGHPDLAVDPVVERGLLARREAVDLDPPPGPERGGVVAEHDGVGVGLPVVEAAQGVDVLLARGPEHERRARRVGRVVGDPVLDAGRHGPVLDLGRGGADRRRHRPPRPVPGPDLNARAGRHGRV